MAFQMICVFFDFFFPFVKIFLEYNQIFFSFFGVPAGFGAVVVGMTPVGQSITTVHPQRPKTPLEQEDKANKLQLLHSTLTACQERLMLN